MFAKGEFLYILLPYLIAPCSLASLSRISNSMEVILATDASLGIAVTTANVIKQLLPAHKVKNGLALLYNGMLLLHQEIDNLPRHIAIRMLVVYKDQAKIYHQCLETTKLDFPRCLAHPKVMCKAARFYKATKIFNQNVQISSSDARHSRAMKAMVEGHPVNTGLPEISNQLAQLISSLEAHLDYFQRLEEMGRVIESKLAEKNPESLSSSSSSTIQVVVNDCADSGYIWGWTEVPSSPIVLADRESGQVGHEEEYTPGLAGLGRS
ncbi:hypothetical protein B0H10DRAFT_2119280 [Mycena sp. CBHHK59/15]|nr:hypothetical protein B0H10DRAFT_2119280 [Mycena sp. CBHHK59/15]